MVDEGKGVGVARGDCHRDQAQPAPLTQVFGSAGVVVLVVLSCRVAVAQSYCTVPEETLSYQNDSLLFPFTEGTVNVCDSVESPSVCVDDRAQRRSSRCATQTRQRQSRWRPNRTRTPKTASWPERSLELSVYYPTP